MSDESFKLSDANSIIFSTAFPAFNQSSVAPTAAPPAANTLPNKSATGGNPAPKTAPAPAPAPAKIFVVASSIFSASTFANPR